MLLKIRKHSINKARLLEYSLLGFVLTMPFKIQINSVFLMLSLLAWFLSGHAKQDVRSLLKTKLYRAYLLLYFLYIVGLLYSANTLEALAALELRISLLLLPPMLHSLVQDSGLRNRFIKVFVLACFVAAVISLLLMLYKIFVLDMYWRPDQPSQVEWVYFSYHMPKQIDFHAPYFSMYTMMCAFILAVGITSPTVVKLGWPTVWKVLLLLFFIVFTVILASRTALVSGMAILALGCTAYLMSQRKYIQLVVILGGAISLFAVLYLNTPYLQRKIEESTGVSQRQRIWEAGIELIRANPLLGVGSGDTKDELALQYEKMGLVSEAKDRLDPHNQYIQIFLALGIGGLIMYLVCLYLVLEQSIRHRLYLLTALVLLYALCGLTESIFSTQKGVILFTFFTSLLAFKNSKSSAETVY
jgi:O-antigen ligase